MATHSSLENPHRQRSPAGYSPWGLKELDIVEQLSIAQHKLLLQAFQVVLVVKNPPANAGDIRDTDLIPGWGRSPGEGNGTPLQYTRLENPMDGGAWQAAVHGVTESRT